MTKNIFLQNIITDQQLPLKVFAIGETQQQPKVVRKKGYPAYHLMLCKSGEGTLYWNNKSFNITANTVFLLKPHQPHAYTPISENWHTAWIVFDGQYAHELLHQLDLLSDEPKKLLMNNCAFMHFNLMMGIAQHNDRESAYKCSSALYTLLLDISCNAQSENCPQNAISSVKIDAALHYIQENWKQNISLQDITAHVQLSPQYLCKLFNATLGVPPYEYLIRFRIQRSKEMMADKALSIQQISLHAGFHDPSYYCAVFKKHEGMTPGQFRKLYY